VEVLPVEGRLEEGLGRAEPLPVLDGRLKVGKAEVVSAVDVEDLVAAVVDGVQEGVCQGCPETAEQILITSYVSCAASCQGVLKGEVSLYH